MLFICIQVGVSPGAQGRRCNSVSCTRASQTPVHSTSSFFQHKPTNRYNLRDRCISHTVLYALTRTNKGFLASWWCIHPQTAIQCLTPISRGYFFKVRNSYCVTRQEKHSPTDLPLCGCSAVNIPLHSCKTYLCGSLQPSAIV